MNADYQWMDESYRAWPGNGENQRDMIDISLILNISDLYDTRIY